MRLGFSTSIAALLAGTGLVLAQAPAKPGPGLATPKNMQASAVSSAPEDSGSTLAPTEAGTFLGQGCAQPPTVDLNCDPHPYCMWVKGEYLLWQIDNSSIPTLLSNSGAGILTFNTTQTVTDSFGTNVVNIPHTVPLLVQVESTLPGGNTVDFGDQPGARLTVGWWLTDDKCFGVDVSGFWLDQKAVHFTSTATNNNQFFQSGFTNDVYISPAPSVPPTLVSSTPVLIGANALTNLDVSSTFQTWGFEVNGRCRKCFFGPVTFDFLTGFRYMDVDETIHSDEFVNLSPVGPLGGPPPTIVPINPFQAHFVDFIDTHNRFYGAQVGVEMEANLCGCFVQACGKLAVGDMHMNYSLQGYTAQTIPTVTTVPGGLLVNAGDNGLVSAERDRICVMPELNVNVGYNFCTGVRGFVGYNLLYISALARPAQQVFTTTTTTTVTIASQETTLTTIAPGFRASSDDAVLQGLNLGLEFRY